MKLKELQEKRLDAARKVHELRETIEGEDRAWTSEEREAFDKHVDAINDFDKEIDAAKADQDRIKRAIEIQNSVDKTSKRDPLETPTVDTNDKSFNARQRDLALRAWALRGMQPKGIQGDVDLGEALEAAKNIGMDLELTNNNAQLSVRGLSTKEYRGIHGQARNMAWLHDQLEKRAMGSEQAAAGQEHVPDEMMQSLEKVLLAFGNVRGLSQVIRTENAGPLPIPKVDDTGNTGEIVAENDAATEEVVPTAQVVLNKHQYSSKIVRVHLSLLLDSGVDTASMVMDACAERVARIQNQHFTVGTGTGQPQGVVTGAGDSGVTLAAADPTYDEMVDIKTALEPSYFGNSTWMFNNAILGGLQKIKATTGTPIWQPSLVPGAPDTILGRPYSVNQHMPTGSSAKGIVLGDFSKYVIRDMRDAYMVRLFERYAEYNQQAFILWYFSDGKVLTQSAFVYASLPA